jgi:D-alanyl-D-alanine carboxypeptidase
VKASQLLERGFNTTVISWLTPAFSTVGALVPVVGTPPNLRDEMCGRHRKRPAAESEDDGDLDESVNAQVESGSSNGYKLSSLGPLNVKPSSLLQPLSASMEPVAVYVGPNKGKDSGGKVATAPAGKKAAKPAPGTPAVAPAQASAAAKAAQPAATQVTAPAFAPTTPSYPSTSAFAPMPAANATPAAPIANVPAPKERPKTVAKPQAAAAPTGVKPAAKPASATAAKPAAKPAQ